VFPSKLSSLIFNRHSEPFGVTLSEAKSLLPQGKLREESALINKGRSFAALRTTPGFTLLELMIAMGVLTFAMALIIYAFTQSMRIFTAELYEGDTAVEIHRSLDRMTKELRSSLEIVSADGISITFWSEDLNNNGTREANETVTYSWTGTSEGYLKRIVQTASIEVASGVKSFSLTYNNPTPSNIRLINIYITVQKGSNLSTLESSVKSRNL